MTSERETPEGMLAAWVASGAIGGADLDRAMDVLSAWVVGFSAARVAELARKLGARPVGGLVVGFNPASASECGPEMPRGHLTCVGTADA